MAYGRRTRMLSTNAEIIRRGIVFDVIYNEIIVGFGLKQELAFDLALDRDQLKKLFDMRKNS